MRNLKFAFLIMALNTSSCYADESASMVQTAGIAELGVVSNYLVLSSEKKFQVSVPRQITVGDILNISYKDGEKIISRSFPVVWISSRKDICWLHDRDRTAGSALSDTIYVAPCKKLQ